MIIHWAHGDLGRKPDYTEDHTEVSGKKSMCQMESSLVDLTAEERIGKLNVRLTDTVQPEEQRKIKRA